MSGAKSSTRDPAAEPAGDDSALTVLRWLAGERGRHFTEAEYREARQSVLEELAHGPRCRPSTLGTFAIIGLLLLAALGMGVVACRTGTLADATLALVSALALGVWGWLLRAYLRGIAAEARRPLDQRLAELEELRAHQLVTAAEYDAIRAAILVGRQG